MARVRRWSVARDKRDAPQDLAVEVAKLKVRVAAEKADPARLIKHGIRSSPLPSVAGALGAGTLLALLRGRGGRAAAANVGRRGGVSAVLLALAAQAAMRYLPELLGSERVAEPVERPPVP